MARLFCQHYTTKEGPALMASATWPQSVAWHLGSSQKHPFAGFRILGHRILSLYTWRTGCGMSLLTCPGQSKPICRCTHKPIKQVHAPLVWFPGNSGLRRFVGRQQLLLVASTCTATSRQLLNSTLKIAEPKSKVSTSLPTATHNYNS